MSKPLFEHVSCSRCGGTGRHSYNQMDGDRCYGCGGSGNKLTKRGQAAQDFFRDRLKVPMAALQVGATYRVDTMSGRQVPMVLESVEESTLNRHAGVTHIVKFRGSSTTHAHHVNGETATFTRLPTQDDRDAALAYQATLTKTGTVAKSKKVAA